MSAARYVSVKYGEANATSSSSAAGRWHDVEETRLLSVVERAHRKNPSKKVHIHAAIFFGEKLEIVYWTFNPEVSRA